MCLLEGEEVENGVESGASNWRESIRIQEESMSRLPVPHGLDTSHLWDVKRF
jgi:hypothetical protein